MKRLVEVGVCEDVYVCVTYLAYFSWYKHKVIHFQYFSKALKVNVRLKENVFFIFSLRSRIFQMCKNEIGQ